MFIFCWTHFNLSFIGFVWYFSFKLWINFQFNPLLKVTNCEPDQCCVGLYTGVITPTEGDPTVLRQSVNAHSWLVIIERSRSIIYKRRKRRESDITDYPCYWTSQLLVFSRLFLVPRLAWSVTSSGTCSTCVFLSLSLILPRTWLWPVGESSHSILCVYVCSFVAVIFKLWIQSVRGSILFSK